MNIELNEAGGSAKAVDGTAPSHWPKGVGPISWNAFELLGVDDADNLYWDGKRIKTEVALGKAAQLVGGLIALFTFLAAAATVSMAIVDVWRYQAGM
ncbi:hypothetical protein LXM94_01965 [Rhizobium sp. TRM95111]|uniref:hypothetical protein n=1 Tax=Rhizobium alarense TaxID=2846851 RepID=UPI001F3BC08D|nr:hypothetical protein [Rhizobium alarense]MCF3638737.1 hypothetical protein [Rhizobium alarense]